jgi:hypothetical protein
MVWTESEGMTRPEASLHAGRYRLNRPLQYESADSYQPFKNLQVLHEQLRTYVLRVIPPINSIT